MHHSSHDRDTPLSSETSRDGDTRTAELRPPDRRERPAGEGDRRCPVTTTRLCTFPVIAEGTHRSKPPGTTSKKPGPPPAPGSSANPAGMCNRCQCLATGNCRHSVGRNFDRAPERFSFDRFGRVGGGIRWEWFALYILLASSPEQDGTVRCALGEVVDRGDVDHGFGGGRRVPWAWVGRLRSMIPRTSPGRPVPFREAEAAHVGFYRGDFAIDSGAGPPVGLRSVRDFPRTDFRLRRRMSRTGVPGVGQGWDSHIRRIIMNAVRVKAALRSRALQRLTRNCRAQQAPA